MSIQSLNPRHYKILDYCLQGWTNKQIADYLNMSQQQVSVVCNSPQFQHELALRRSKLNDMKDQMQVSAEDDVTSAIKRGTKDAIARLLGGETSNGQAFNGLIHSEDESIALRASTEILDRGGHPKVQRMESKSLSVVLTAEDAMRIKETMMMDLE